MSEIAKVLNAAADLLEKPGAWMQGKSSGVRADGTRCFCTMGAIRHLTGESHSDAEEYFRDRHLPEWGGITGWNDHPGQKQDNVVETLRLAAERDAQGAGA